MQKTAAASLLKLDMVSSGWGDYELLDSGNRKKLERFGDRIITRLEPAADWLPALPKNEWDCAWADYHLPKGQQQGKWVFHKALDPQWEIKYGALCALLAISSSRHIGIFPEQHLQWDWIAEKIRATGEPVRVLNLFGYTGLASLAAASAGAQVTHVDASQSALDRLKQNLALSGLAESPVRLIKDDVLKFIQREIRRGNRYQAILVDPPNFGRGPKGEVWKFEKSFTELLASCHALLDKRPLFLLATAYNVPIKPGQLANSCQEIFGGMPGHIYYGSLEQKEKSAGRLIYQAIYAKWESEE